MVCIDLVPGDEERLLTFYNALSGSVTDTFRPFPEISLGIMRKHLAEANAGRHISIGIDHSAKIVGHGFLMDIDKKHPVFGIGLMEAFQRRGWGHRLMGAVWNKGKGLGISHMTLTVVKNNTRALSLYQDFGFKVAGDHTFKEKNDSYIMRYDGDIR